MFLTIICKYDVVGSTAPFCSLDETHEQHIGTVKALAECWGVLFSSPEPKAHG